MKKGFTLMELLVTLGLFASIMAVLMNVFFQFKDQTTRFETMMALRQEFRILEHLLRQDLQAAVYLPEFVTQGPEQVTPNPSGIVGVDEIDGDMAADLLHMHVNRRSRFFRGLDPGKDPELHEVSYYISEDENGAKRFVRREQFYIDAEIAEGENSITHPLSENVVGFDVHYFLLSQTDPLDGWGTEDIKREFEKATGIPAGVQVTLQLRNPSGEKLESSFQVNLKPDMGGGIEWK